MVPPKEKKQVPKPKEDGNGDFLCCVCNQSFSTLEEMRHDIVGVHRLDMCMREKNQGAQLKSKEETKKE